MKAADVTSLLALAAEKGWPSFDDFDARAILASQEIIANDSSHEAAQHVLAHFKEALEMGTWTDTFSGFLISQDALRTDEEKAESERRRQEFLKRQQPCKNSLL